MSEFIEVQTSCLIGPALSWAVGVAEGRELSIEPAIYGVGPRVFAAEGLTRVRYRPDTDWLQGGALLDKYQVTLCAPSMMLSGYWEAFIGAYGAIDGKGSADIKGRHESFDKRPLAAVCRVVVKAKLGEVVSIPVELMT